jgi:DNA replication protein DnaC
MSDKEINEIEFVEIVDGVKRVSFLTEKQLLNKLFIYRESPDKYLELRLEEQSPTFYVNSKELYVALNEFLKKGNLSGMYIYGQVAVGKTFLISSFLNSYLLKYHPTVSYIDMTKL